MSKFSSVKCVGLKNIKILLQNNYSDSRTEDCISR